MHRRERKPKKKPLTTEQIFHNIYIKNLWQGTESKSGPGSGLEVTEKIRLEIPLLLKELKCKSLLDIPCGDFNWMNLVNLNVEYIGADIVGDLIDDNKKKYNKNFIKCDLINDKLPLVDIILCRDCLVHLPLSDAIKAIKNMDAQYLLITTYENCEENKDIKMGDWRPLNLELPPFCLIKLKLIHEGGGKSLGLFKKPPQKTGK